VPLDEIRTNDYNLNITRYLDVSEKEEIIDVQKVLDELKTLKEERSTIENRMKKYLKELGYRI
jgi:type I restriction enzyme M protein